MKNRLELAQHFKELGFKLGAEIGVAKGYYSEVLLAANPDLHLLAIDIWTSGRRGDYAIALEKLDEYIKQGRCTILRKKSMGAAKEIKDESLDFVYIDAAHDYTAVKNDIEAWAPKVRVGGIVSGHDYLVKGRLEVVPAVDDYITKHKLELYLTDPNKDPYKDNRQPSWFFYKK